MPTIRATIDIKASDIGKANVIITGALRDWQNKNRETINYKVVSVKELEDTKRR
jgi:hypothetical protein